MGNVIDVRKAEQEVVSIIWSDGCYIDQQGPIHIGIHDEDGAIVELVFEEVEHLIKALEEAKKQWG